MSIIVGILVGAFVPILYHNAGRLWSVIYGASFILGVFALDLIYSNEKFSYMDVSSLLISFAATVVVGHRVYRTRERAVA